MTGHSSAVIERSRCARVSGLVPEPMRQELTRWWGTEGVGTRRQPQLAGRAWHSSSSHPSGLSRRQGNDAKEDCPAPTEAGVRDLPRALYGCGAWFSLPVAVGAPCYFPALTLAELTELTEGGVAQPAFRDGPAPIIQGGTQALRQLSHPTPGTRTCSLHAHLS